MEPTFEQYMLQALKVMTDKKVRKNKEISPPLKNQLLLI